MHTGYNSSLNFLEDNDYRGDDFMTGTNAWTHTNPDVIDVMETPITMTWSDLFTKNESRNTGTNVLPGNYLYLIILLGKELYCRLFVKFSSKYVSLKIKF